MSGGMSATAAIIGSGGLAAINTFLAGYVGGKAVFPYCFKINAGKLRLLGCTILAGVSAITVWSNLKAWEVRAKLRVDPQSPTYETDLLVSNLTGGTMAVVGLGLAGYWFYRYATSQDLNKAYGALGDERTELQKELKVPAEQCRADIINMADQASKKLQEIRKAGAQALIQSETCKLEADGATESYEGAQDRLISEFTGVIGLARNDGRQILEDLTPAYFGAPPNLTGLRKTAISTTMLEARFNRQEAQHNALTAELEKAEASITQIVEAFRARIKKEFGA